MLYLASASPRRKALLQQIGVPLTVVRTSVDETHRLNESPLDLVCRLATEKAAAGAALAVQPWPVLGADTVVVLDQVVLGKPANRDEGVAMLMRLAGRSHQVITAVAIWHQGSSQVVPVTTEVVFRDISLPEAERYWQSGEPQDKAGGYGIQGLGAVFVRSICGSYSNVVGLPLYETAELLSAVGVAVWQVNE